MKWINKCFTSNSMDSHLLHVPPVFINELIGSYPLRLRAIIQVKKQLIILMNIVELILL